MNILPFEAQNTVIPAADIYSDLLRFYSDPSSNRNNGIKTGFDRYDLVTGGLQNGELLIIGARPGMGKTSLLLSIILNNNCFDEFSGVYFSLDTKPQSLMRRLLGMLSGIALNKLKSGELSAAELEIINTKTNFLSASKLLFVYPDMYSIERVVENCERMVKENGAKIIFIDYLQLLRYERKGLTRDAELAHIVRVLKYTAIKLNVPIIALSQLSRAVETRGGDKKPQLSDLRESGAIEQDSDKVIFLYRPDYYGFTEDEDGNSLEGMAELIVAKNKEGALFNMPLHFNFEQATFDNYEEKKFSFYGIRQDEFDINKSI